MPVAESLYRWFCRLAAVIAAAIGLVLLVLLGRIATWHQTDDEEHLAAKRAYLETIRAGGVAPDAPDVVLILFDDLGYGDLGAYGTTAVRTPNLDRLAAEGIRFDSAYAASPYCSASRAGLLTGRHAVRAGLDHVLQAPGTWQDLLLRLGWRNRRLPAEEITLSEVLSAAGYRTAIYGKWHLGDFSPSLPNQRGFDDWWGLLHSNDQGEPAIRANGEIVEPYPIDQSTLTRRYTEHAVDFIAGNARRPFFLYLPHTFPHVPLHVAEDRSGRSAAGLYGDVVEELDWSVGRVVEELERRDLAARTLLVVSSDNGPWFQGSPAPLRGRKFDLFEGGTRVPLLLWGPGLVKGGRVVAEPVSLLDIFPTVLARAGLAAPGDRVIDGVDLSAVLAGGPVEERPIYFHQLGEARAVRLGRFKYHARHAVPYGNPMNWPWSPSSYRGPWLFDLGIDAGESYDATLRHPQEAVRLAALLAEWRRALAADPRGWR